MTDFPQKKKKIIYAKVYLLLISECDKLWKYYKHVEKKFFFKISPILETK